MVASILYTEPASPDSLRALLALTLCRIRCELREIDPQNPPDDFRMVSMRSSLPLLVQSNGNVVERSHDLLYWAVETQDPAGLWPDNVIRQQSIRNLIQTHDASLALTLREYPSALDGHKLAAARMEAEVFLAQLEARLSRNERLVGEKTTLADIAIFPFVHRLAQIDRNWFNMSPYRNIRRWIKLYAVDACVVQCMAPRPFWSHDASPRVIG